MQTFKINFTSHIRSAQLIIFSGVICFNIPRILSILYPDQRNEESILIEIVVFALLIMPAVITHVNYYFVNKGDVLVYSSQEQKIGIVHNGLSITFISDDIECAEQFKYFPKTSTIIPSKIPLNAMKRLAIKVIGYLFLSYILFYLTISLADSQVKIIRLSDLQSKKDWFMFSWLFLLPLVLELIMFTYPFTYGLSKVSESKNKIMYYGLFLILFIIEFVLYHYVFSINYAIVKAGISCLLLVILFRKKPSTME